MVDLVLTTPAFKEGGWIPSRHAPEGEDMSPELHISGIADGAASLAVTFDDASHPLFPNYNHWVMWNVPVMNVIPEAVPKGECVDALGGAVQGVAYGRHCYKGPKPPFKTVHMYTFTVYALDCLLQLPATSDRDAVLAAMEGHILQKATLSGTFQKHRKRPRGPRQ